MSDMIVYGRCRCGAEAVQVFNADTEARLGMCHRELAPLPPPTPEEQAFATRCEAVRTSAPEHYCAWCYGEACLGRPNDVMRPLTAAELAHGGFFACHGECAPKQDAFMAELAARGVFVDVRPAD